MSNGKIQYHNSENISFHANAEKFALKLHDEILNFSNNNTTQHTFQTFLASSEGSQWRQTDQLYFILIM